MWFENCHRVTRSDCSGLVEFGALQSQSTKAKLYSGPKRPQKQNDPAFLVLGFKTSKRADAGNPTVVGSLISEGAACAQEILKECVAKGTRQRMIVTDGAGSSGSLMRLNARVASVGIQETSQRLQDGGV